MANLDSFLIGAAVCFVFRTGLDLRYMRWNPVDDDSPALAALVAGFWLGLPVALGIWVSFECRNLPDMVSGTWAFVAGWFLSFGLYWAVRRRVGFRKRNDD